MNAGDAESSISVPYLPYVQTMQSTIGGQLYIQHRSSGFRERTSVTAESTREP